MGPGFPPTIAPAPGNASVMQTSNETTSALHNAAREGARYGAVHHCDTAGIITMAQQMAAGLGEGISVTPTIEYNVGGAPVRIKVHVAFRFRAVTPLIGTFFGSDGSIILKSQSHHHIENSTACY